MKAPDWAEKTAWHHGFGEGYKAGQAALREKLEWNKYLAETSLVERASKKEYEVNEPYRAVLEDMGNRLRVVAAGMRVDRYQDEVYRIGKWCRRLSDLYSHSPQEYLALIDNEEYVP